MLSPFLVFPQKIPYPFPPSPCSPTQPLPLPCPGIPLPWDIKPSQDQEPLLPLMTYMAILCYICCWSHGSLHVYSLDGGLVPGSSRGTGWFILLFFLWGCSQLTIGLRTGSPMEGLEKGPKETGTPKALSQPVFSICFAPPVVSPLGSSFLTS
jgi:hypothetical protein